MTVPSVRASLCTRTDEASAELADASELTEDLEVIEASELIYASVQWRCRQALELDDVVVSVSVTSATVLVRVTNTVRVRSTVVANSVDGDSLLLLLFAHGGGRLTGVTATGGQSVSVKTVGKPVGPPEALPLQ